MAALFPDKVIVQTGKTKYETQIKAGVHTLIADEPKDLQGTDLGPNPNQLLASALGACTAITIRMYADRKEMPLDKVEIQLEIDKIAPDNHKVFRTVVLIGNLTADERDRLLKVANACPVHKLLSGTIEIETSLGE
ncbi:OsmC family protein [Leptospira sp. 96542]|nr:OsmC family protein [Leptospira sp. 96542]